MIERWDEDALDYGYVLRSLPEGGWWHVLFARSGLEYRCELLGHSTRILAAIQRFARGASSASETFVLTLDGEGISEPDDVLRLDFDWGKKPADVRLQAEARSFQTLVMPLLHDSESFQRAAWEIVDYHQHRQMVDPAKLTPAE